RAPRDRPGHRSGLMRTDVEHASPGRPSAALADLAETVRARLARDGSDLSPARLAAALRGPGAPVGGATVLAGHAALSRDVTGAGLLGPLRRTPGLPDGLVNGPDEGYLDRGRGLERTGVRLPDDAAVRRLAQRLAANGG